MLRHELWFEGVVRKLEDAFRNRPEWVEDAVATSFEKAVKSEHVFATVNELKKWLYTVSVNEMKGRAKREASRPHAPWEPEEGDVRSAEDDALEGIFADELHAELRELIRRWPSARWQAVALFVLEMERAGEPFSGQDIVEHVADILGDDISVKAANRLRRLVLERLTIEITGQPTNDDDEEMDE